MQAFNPYLPSFEYVPDGEPYVYNNRLYVFGSHDKFNGTQFCMNDYVCWSAPLENLGNWKYEGIIYKKSQDPSAKEDSIMQAPDIIQGADGRFYLYYTLGLCPYMAVAVSKIITGPYEYMGVVKDKNGIPVGIRQSGQMEETLDGKDVFQFDPGIFIDEDKRVYLYSGFAPEANGIFAAACQKYHLDGAYVMELEADMYTIKTEPKRIVPGIEEATGTSFEKHPFFEASSMKKINKKYYFIYSSILSHELCYAVSDYPDRAFEYGGILISNGDLGVQDNTIPRNYLGNTHGGIEKVNGRWYVFYHRQTNRHQYSRQGCAERIVMDENGYFIQAEMTSCGLNSKPLIGSGTYEARIACNLWGKEGALTYGLAETPEAENHPYFTQDGEDREEEGNQYIANMQEGATAGYKYFNLQRLKRITIETSCADGEMWVHTDLKKEPLCKISIKEKSATFPAITGIYPLYFVYHGDGAVDFYEFRLEENICE